MGDESNKLISAEVNIPSAPYDKAVDTATQGLIDGAKAFLGSVCLPACQELGGLIQDRVSHWRRLQGLKLIQKWQKKMEELGMQGQHAPPRLIETGLERGSIVDSDELQDMWAGLLASSCTEGGTDDSNLIFMSILDQLTIPQAKIVRYACENAKIGLDRHGLLYTVFFSVDLDTLFQVSEIDDIQRLDRELDHLRTLEILEDGGFPSTRGDVTADSAPSRPESAVLTPSAKAVHFYVRCQGFVGPPAEYLGLKWESPIVEAANPSEVTRV